MKTKEEILNDVTGINILESNDDFLNNAKVITPNQALEAMDIFKRQLTLIK